MEDLIEHLSEFSRKYLAGISIALISTLLALYGGWINRAVKKSLKGIPALGRFVVFVLLCAFGYGALCLFAARLVQKGMSQLSDQLLFPVIFFVFFILGVLADQNNKI